MPADVKNLSKDEFSSFIQQGTVLVDFWAVWCGPCRTQGTIIEQLAKEDDFSTPVGKINVDDERDLAVEYQVSSIPTLIIFKNGTPVARFVGVQQPAAIKAALAKA